MIIWQHCVIVLSDSRSAMQISNVKKFGAWLKQKRKGKFSQRDLATAIGCSYPTIANIERNSNIPTIDVFLKIVEVLGYYIEIKTTAVNGE